MCSHWPFHTSLIALYASIMGLKGVCEGVRVKGMPQIPECLAILAFWEVKDLLARG